MPSREELWNMLREQGASTSDSVSKRTSCLVVGEGYGQTKIQKAIKHSIPTISLPMFEYLNLLNHKGTFALDPQLKETLPLLLINHAFICELLYAQYLRHVRLGATDNATRTLGTFYQLVAGLDELLRIAWRDVPGTDTSTSDELGELLLRLDAVRV